MYYYLIAIISFFITLLAQIYINVSYSKYKKVKSVRGMTGFDVASTILKEHGIDDIYVIETKGTLTDHYDPTNNVIRLSTEVFHGTDIAACSVAAHEAGHVIQHVEGNKLIKIRSMLVPFVNFCSKIGYLVIAIGLISSILQLFYLGIILLSTILLFQLVTLPVEFDASSKALENLKKLQILSSDELGKGKKMLFAAALTYVASLITTILEIFRLILMASDRD